MKKIAVIIGLAVLSSATLCAQEGGYYAVPGLKNFEGVWESDVDGKKFTLTLEVYVHVLSESMKFDNIKGDYTYMVDQDTISRSPGRDGQTNGILNGSLVNRRESDRELTFMFRDGLTGNTGQGLLELLPGKNDEATFTIRHRDALIVKKEDADRRARGFSVPQEVIMKKVR